MPVPNPEDLPTSKTPYFQNENGTAWLMEDLDYEDMLNILARTEETLDEFCQNALDPINYAVARAVYQGLILEELPLAHAPEFLHLGIANLVNIGYMAVQRYAAQQRIKKLEPDVVAHSLN